MKPEILYIVTRHECKYVLTAQENFEASRVVGGPCGYKPKLWKTREGAQRWIDARSFKPGECKVAIW